MAYSCSECDFTSQFESALIMHQQLHHGTPMEVSVEKSSLMEKSNTVPRVKNQSPFQIDNHEKSFKLPGRTSSATRLFDKLRAKICKSRMLFSHPEEISDPIRLINDISVPSECTSKQLKMDSMSRASAITTCIKDQRETYGCHLCAMEFDRITALDRHLLNDHKINLEDLLKLVLTKTKEGLNEENTALGLKQPYYKQPDEIIEDGEFIIETVAPKIKILKHTATNTELKFNDIIENTNDLDNDNDLLSKMKVLNDCMCKFVDSSNALKKVLAKEIDSKTRRNEDDRIFNLSLGDHDSPRDWNRAHSENLHRHGDRVDKNKMSTESFYF